MTNTSLGTPVGQLRRSNAHIVKLGKLVQEIQELFTVDAKLPKVYQSASLYDYDVIIVEGQDAWNNQINEHLTKKYKDAHIENQGGGIAKIYIPVKKESSVIFFITHIIIISLSMYALHFFGYI